MDTPDKGSNTGNSICATRNLLIQYFMYCLLAPLTRVKFNINQYYSIKWGLYFYQIYFDKHDIIYL